MCLTSKRYNSREKRNIAMKPLIAKKDMTVYKILKKFNLRSPYKNFRYEKGFHYYEDKKLVPRIGINIGYYFTVNEGLHCFKDKIKAINYMDVWLNDCEIHEMIIPKDSKYFIGSNGDIATDNLIFPL